MYTKFLAKEINRRDSPTRRAWHYGGKLFGMFAHDMVLFIAQRCMRLFFIIFAGALLSAQAPSQTTSQDATLGQLFATDASVHGAMQLAGSGTQLMSGSTVSAGSAAATIKLTRGGEVRVCPGTSVVLGSSDSARELLLSLNTGSLEANYSLNASADSIITPDFRIQLAGPGNFHLALSADLKGNTCVRALPGNNAAIVVSELMGDGAYQVKPNEEVHFSAGRVNAFSHATSGGCGCAPAGQTLLANNPSPNAAQNLAMNNNALASASNPQPVFTAKPKPEPQASPAIQPLAPVASAATAIQPLPASAPGEVHVQVEAPFVFSAATAPAPAASLPAPNLNLLPQTSYSQFSAFYAPQVILPPTESPAASNPVAVKSPNKRGFFRRIGRAFASFFSK